MPDSLSGFYPDPADSTSNLPEPFAVYPDTVTVPPGELIILDPIHIQKAAKNDE